MSANLVPQPSPLDERKFYAAIRVLPANLVGKLVFEKATSCWKWIASAQPNGSGRVWDGERLVYAHRRVYESLLFSIKPSHDLSQLCRDDLCCNPEHQEQLTRSETLRRGGVGERIAAIERAKTHCPRGHEYNDANTCRTLGRRKCRACARIRYHLSKPQAQAAA